MKAEGRHERSAAEPAVALRSVLALRGDERGAIMILGLFFAIFLVSILYSAIGVAQAVLFRERLQDAADTVALSSAIFHARSMNLVVLVNVVMAALLAILVTLKLLQTLALVGLTLATGLAWPTFGASLAAVPPLQVLEGKMRVAYDQLKPPIETALETLNEVSDLIIDLAPEAATAAAWADLPAPASAGFVTAADELPLEDDDYAKLCGQAGKLPFELAKKSLEPIGLGVLLEPLSGAIDSLATTFADWFCGSDESGPPAYEQEEEVWYPRLPSAEQCGDKVQAAVSDWVSQGSAAEAKSPDCSLGEKEERDSQPDDDGNCRAGSDCSLGGPYEERVALARVQCDPTSSPRFDKYVYQKRAGTVEYVWNGRAWRRGTPSYQRPERVESSSPPCGPWDVRPEIAEGYDFVVRKTNQIDEVRPVCSNERAPSMIPHRWGASKNAVEVVRFVEVRHILACSRKELVRAEVEAERSEGSDDRSAKRVLEDAKLGDGHFQLRSLVLGEPRLQGTETIVRLASWGEELEERPLEEFVSWSRFAVAQAEFFYDAPDERAAWMWNMKWRARLRRFRADAEELEELRKRCGGALGALTEGDLDLWSCGALIGHVEKFGDFVLH